jgi:hypothetical protein
MVAVGMADIPLRITVQLPKGCQPLECTVNTRDRSGGSSLWTVAPWLLQASQDIQDDTASANRVRGTVLAIRRLMRSKCPP